MATHQKTNLEAKGRTLPTKRIRNLIQPNRHKVVKETNPDKDRARTKINRKVKVREVAKDKGMAIIQMNPANWHKVNNRTNGKAKVVVKVKARERDKVENNLKNAQVYVTEAAKGKVS